MTTSYHRMFCGLRMEVLESPSTRPSDTLTGVLSDFQNVFISSSNTLLLIETASCSKQPLSVCHFKSMWTAAYIVSACMEPTYTLYCCFFFSHSSFYMSVELKTVQHSESSVCEQWECQTHTQSYHRHISTKFVINRWGVCVCLSFMIPGYKCPWQKTVKHFEMSVRTSRALNVSKYCHKYLKRSFCPGVQVLCSAAQRPIHSPSTKM